MLRTFVIGSGGALNGELTAALANFADVEIVRTFAQYPAPEDLLRSIRAHKPDFLFFCLEDLSQMEVLVTRLDDLLPGFLVVAVGGKLEPAIMRKLMQLGVREYLPAPVQGTELAEVLVSVQRALKQHPPPVARVGDLYTFLPAKPGVGTSTIAASMASALANDLGTHTLLMDCDLDAGTTKFLLKLGTTASVVDAFDHASKLDEDLLSQMVGKWEKLDVLHAGGLNPPANIDAASLQAVLAIARSQYDVICADLASSLDSLAVGLMRESRRIFLVTTAEMVPLHLARERMQRLTELGLRDQVRLLLNRKPGGKGSLDDGEVAQMVGIPVSYSFPNDYPRVQDAILGANPIASSTDLGESILALARSVTSHHGSKEAPLRRRFLEFFHVAKADDPDVAWHH
jgi:pilus assembly protein CpaE